MSSFFSFIYCVLYTDFNLVSLQQCVNNSSCIKGNTTGSKTLLPEPFICTRVHIDTHTHTLESDDNCHRVLMHHGEESYAPDLFSVSTVWKKCHFFPHAPHIFPIYPFIHYLQCPPCHSMIFIYLNYFLRRRLILKTYGIM